jgi:hypothetical protein
MKLDMGLNGDFNGYYSINREKRIILYNLFIETIMIFLAKGTNTARLIRDKKYILDKEGGF